MANGSCRVPGCRGLALSRVFGAPLGLCLRCADALSDGERWMIRMTLQHPLWSGPGVTLADDVSLAAVELRGLLDATAAQIADRGYRRPRNWREEAANR